MLTGAASTVAFAERTVRARRVGARPRQGELPFRSWGGARPGAGRKPNGPKAGVSHLRRAALPAHTPAHVTLRLRAGLPSLRRRSLFRRVHRALIEGRERFGFRVCEYSVQGNHIHLIAEAPDRRALWRGLQGLCVRIARTVNRELARRGGVFADRYHARPLKTPLEVRNALRYVLQNNAHHRGVQRAPRPSAVSGPPVNAEGAVHLDSCSSAASFCGWRGQSGGPSTPLVADEAVVKPRTWLLRIGWRRWGLLRVAHAPPRAGPT